MSSDKPKMPARLDETAGLSAAAATPDPAVRARLMAELRGRERWTLWTTSVADLLGIPETDALFALQQIDDDSAWRPGLWPSSRVLQTPKLAEARALIASLRPGTHIAQHGHTERELTYVLNGELVEDERRSYGCGDLVDMKVGSEHSLTVKGTNDCLVVFFLRPG